ncbi:MAG TPA: Rieske (2Fe-2S) protein [Terriglobales bacterium]|nr:Rieske (2Fe-2S) protein [Terriglobales bacterium]
MALVRIGSRSDMPPDGMAREFTVGEKVVCVANVEGRLSAMDNVCLHRGGPLGQGVVTGGKVICPWHGWAWDPQTGEAAHAPQIRVAIYPLKVEGDDVFVEV